MPSDMGYENGNQNRRRERLADPKVSRERIKREAERQKKEQEKLERQKKLEEQRKEREERRKAQNEERKKQKLEQNHEQSQEQNRKKSKNSSDEPKLTNRLAVEILIAVILLGAILCAAYAYFSDTQETVFVGEATIETETEEEEEKALRLEDISFQPHCVESTEPSKLIDTTEILMDDVLLDSQTAYQPSAQISFDLPENYTAAEGVVTFRGDNFRNSPNYGFAEMSENKLESLWSADTGGLTYGDSTWTGSGWTGQPLLMKWSKELRAHMNMKDWAKEEEELVEVIYACMDGYIYFLDLKTGKATRDAMYLGFVCKGSGALDPRGYPILYVGAGYDSYEGTARAFIINLMDCSIMYTFGNNDSFSLRGDLSYFDSSALVDAETDTLIYPGENGILYLIHLNSSFDPQTGTLSVDPDHMVKWHYYGTRTSIGSYWVGMEDSAVILKGYLFVADNGGNLMCIDLNTLQLVWVQDILDDSNGTPVMTIEDGHPYIYISTSFHLGWRSSTSANVPIWKIDAETGEIIWQTEYECYSVEGVSGGVQSTIAAGKYELSDYIYVTVSRTGEAYNGVLVCLNKNTGEKVWEHTAYYAWSSPVCVYNSDGTGRVLYCTCAGTMFLLDAKTGAELDKIALSEGAIEASPAVYEDIAVIGTRACKIWGIHLK